MFYCIGGANIDLYCKSINDLIMKDSNPSEITFSFGGVARNVAMNLAHLKEDVSFLTVFGKDSFADELINDLRNNSIDLSYSLRSDRYSTSMFVAILDKEDMVVGANDLSVLNEISKKDFDLLGKVVEEDDYLFFDTNFSKEIIAYILDKIDGIKVCDGVSANKAIKLEHLTGRIDYLKLNLLEAEALYGQKLDDDNKIAGYMNELINDGTKELIISSKDAVYVGCKNGIFKYSHNAYNQNPVNTLGAGDALISYYVHFRKEQKDIDEAIGLALSASILSTYNKEAEVVNSLKEVENKYREIHIIKERLG